MNSLLDFSIFAGYIFVFVALPFLVAHLFCKSMRVQDYSVRLGFVLFSIALGFAPFVRQIVRTEYTAYTLADTGEFVSLEDVDVAQGVVAASKKPVVAQELPPAQVANVDGRSVLARDRKIVLDKQLTVKLSRWQDALTFGIDLAGGTNLVYQLVEKDDEPITDELMDRMVGAVSKRINPAGTKEVTVRRVGRDRIEVIIPGANQAAVEETKKLISRLGSLEFGIVANRIDHKNEVQRALASPRKDVRVNNRVVARWVPIRPNVVDGQLVPNRDFDGDESIAVRQIKGLAPGFNELLIINEPDPDRKITGKLLTRANPTNDESGRPAVGFHFNQRGASLFSALTQKNRPTQEGRQRRLAILLDDKVITAPNINSVIGADGIIQGRFTQKEVNDQVSVLNAGSLPRELKPNPISEFSISPTLGYDVQSKGKLALWVSSLAVVVFMAAYYLVAGLVADFAMILNLLFIVSVMAFIQAAFTLPGLAGLVLSAGMAVDANVLIYERIREETQRGASLRMAIHNGFDRALVAIVDSNLTTLITAVILYMIGTEQVKGFAVSLFIGLVMNLYTAVFVSRLILNIFEKTRITKELKMMSAIGHTSIDFVGKQFVATTASVILIIAGLAAFVARGDENYDIDFTGGTMITMQFMERQETDDVRHKLEEVLGSNITLEELTISGSNSAGTLFRLRTTNQDEGKVEETINSAFRNQLVRKEMTPGKIEPIAASAKKPDAKDAKTGEAEAADDETFADGRKVELAFSREIAASTVQDYFERELTTINDDKYRNVTSLLAIRGIAGTGMSAAEGQSRQFSKVVLEAAKEIDEKDLQAAVTAVRDRMHDKPTFDEVTSFDSSVAYEAKESAVIAIVASLIAIVAYIWFRFQNVVFGLSAVVALAHDVLVALACVALGSYLSRTPVGPLLGLVDFKINMPMIAVFLTIVGYSLNDTIVIFDRLREVRGKNPTITREMINLTVNQTLSRTILTALTVFLTVLILYALGGEGIHGFAFCMLIGSVAGTYSTVYIASPLVLWFMKRALANSAKMNQANRPAA